MHVTIVSYTFPPSKEIGGRRWAKFSQQFAKKGHQVTVICADNSVATAWYTKEFPGVQVKQLPKCYPDWLSGYTSTLREKVLYNLYTRFLNHFTKQNYFDRGFAWKKPMLQALESVHRNNPIDVMVVTGAPFSLLFYGSEFKMRYKEIQYVADLRDPWTWGGYYGIPDLAPAKKKFQELSEKTTIETCDLVCYPTEHMGNFLKNKYAGYASKMNLLPHAFDPEKFPQTINNKKRAGFIYGGSLYPGIEEYIKCLAKVLEANPHSGFKWDIYTGSHYPLIQTNFNENSVALHGFIPEDELFRKIASASAYLAFFPVTDKDLISTKFFEIIYSQTPILYVGEEGDVSRFVTENRIGVHILPQNIERDLPRYLNGNVPFEPGYFDVTQYTFSAVTDNFLRVLKNLNPSDRQSKSLL